MTIIEWVRSPDGTQGCTINSKTGCLNGCQYCYAYRLAHGRLKQRYLANTHISQEISARVSSILPPSDPFYPRWWPERLEQIRRVKKPTGVFLDDMSDWMGDYWPQEWTKMEVQVMKDCPQHRFYTLTKQSQNLPQFSPFPENCYVGVTATNLVMLMQACSTLGYSVQAKFKYLSLEPLLDWTLNWNISYLVNILKGAGINWLIIGACTGTKNEMEELHKQYPDLTSMPWGKRWTLQPRIEWIRDIIKVCRQAHIPYFLKNNLKSLLEDPEYNMPIFWKNYHFELRQEMPV